MHIINWTDIDGAAAALPFATRLEIFEDRGMIEVSLLGPKAQATRARLEKAACRLFVARGVAETTTRDIASEAGVSEGTIYRYFESKEALALSLFSDIHARLAAAIDAAHAPHGDIAGKTRAIIHAYCALADAEWLAFSYHLLVQHMMLRHLPAGHPNPNAIATGLITDAMARGEIPRRNADVLASALLGLVLQPAVSKIYGHDIGALSAQADWLADAAVRILEE